MYRNKGANIRGNVNKIHNNIKLCNLLCVPRNSTHKGKDSLVFISGFVYCHQCVVTSD